MGRKRVSSALLLVLTQLVLSLAQAQDADLEAAQARVEKLYRQGKYAEGIAEGRKVLEQANQRYGANALQTAPMLNDLGRIYSAAGQYDTAEWFLQQSLAIKEPVIGKNHISIAITLANLGAVHRHTGRYSQALAVSRRSLTIYETALGRDHPGVAGAISDLALVYQEMGQYAQAEPLFQRCRTILEAKFGNDHIHIADIQHNLALLYTSMGQYDKAEKLYLNSLKIKEATLPKDHPAIALTLNNLGSLYTDSDQYAKAEPLYLRSLALSEKTLGKDHPDVGRSLNNLAVLYWKTRRYDKAEELFKRSLAIRETALGKAHPDVAAILNNLGVLYWNNGQYAKGRQFLERCLKIRDAKLGAVHPLTALTLCNLAELSAVEGQWSEALALTNRHRKLIRSHVRRTFPVLSDGEQLMFLKNMDEGPLHVALTVGLERRTDASLTAASAAWLLNGKAIAQETLAERARLALASDDPKTARIALQLIGTRQQLAALTLSLPSPGQEANRHGQIARLTEHEQQLARQLGQLVGKTSRADPWVRVEEVRRALPDDGIFIDIARFRVANFTARGEDMRWKGYRYAAWLVPPAGQGDVHLIDLGAADKIDAAVADVRRGLLVAQGSANQKSVILEKGEPDAEKDLQPALAALAQLVLQPLADHLNRRKQWLLSPDGALSLVPCGALPLDEKTYVLEKHTLRYLVSGRDLATPAVKPPAHRDPPLVVADPDFDLDPKEALALAAKLLGQPAPRADALALAAGDRPDGRRSRGLLGTAGRLEGTAREAAAVKPKLATYAGEAPWVYRGKNALEAVVKAFHSPRVVVLSTHGFFLETQELQDEGRAAVEGTQRPVSTRDGQLPENPLLRCGLLLAGCNEAGRVGSGQEDGVLTGLEIAGLDLRGTELVVLSACETGLGQVHNGEGVAGLRQAFQLAGARAVVATLWQVPDNDTALLMSDFFGQLAAGTSKAEALRQAQLSA